MNIYASQPYKNTAAEGYLYDHFQLKFWDNRYVWLFINSRHDKPAGYLIQEDREIRDRDDDERTRYYLDFELTDLEGEYIGDICIDTV